MVVFSAFRRSLHVVALALCSASFAVSMTSAASARSHHGAGRHARAYHGSHYARRSSRHRHHREFAGVTRWDRGVATMQAGGLADSQANYAPATSSGATLTSGSFGSSNLVMEARHYLGGNPTSRRSLWCARFMNMVLERTGHHGTGSDLAASFAHYGERVSGPQVGAIAVMGRRGGGHVGIITGIDAKGNPIMISGNNGNRVREAPVSRGRIYAYVLPAG
jgi:uncharacterized protein (TIGR02594 family)